MIRTLKVYIFAMFDCKPTLNITELLNLLCNLVKELNLDIEQYQAKEKNSEAFKGELDTYHSKLTSYISDIDNWHDFSLTSEEAENLNKSALLADEAQHLITKAIGLLKH